MKIPNLISRSLYVDQLQALYLPTAQDQDSLKRIRNALFRTGDLHPTCEFIETRLFQVLSNRDYPWTNELAIKVMFMTVLYDDRMYMVVSETEVNHGYADLSFIVRPDFRQYKPFDLVLEFKYVGLKEVGLSGQALKEISREALMQLPPVAAKLQEAEDLAVRYGDILKERYKLDRITRFAIVAIGLERVVYR